MAGQLVSDASGYNATEFDTKIPSLNYQANIVEAFKLYHYGIDNYTGSGFPAADSIHSHLETLDDRLVVLESTPDGVFTLTGTANEIAVSNSGVGAVTLSLPANVTISNNLTISGDLIVNGNTTTLNTATLTVEDKNIVLANVGSPTDTTADGAGFTIKGATDKTLNWVDATDAWTSSEHIALAAGKTLIINGTTVLSNTNLQNVIVDGGTF